MNGLRFNVVFHRTDHVLWQWEYFLRFGECPIESICNVPGEFYVLLLILSDGDVRCPKWLSRSGKREESGAIVEHVPICENVCCL